MTFLERHFVILFSWFLSICFAVYWSHEVFQWKHENELRVINERAISCHKVLGGIQ